MFDSEIFEAQHDALRKLVLPALVLVWGLAVVMLTAVF